MYWRALSTDAITTWCCSRSCGRILVTDDLIEPFDVAFFMLRRLWELGLLGDNQKHKFLSHNGYSPESVGSPIGAGTLVVTFSKKSRARSGRSPPLDLTDPVERLSPKDLVR